MNTIGNNITLIGNMGMSAHITNFGNGNKVARFSMATDQNSTANDGKPEKRTEWYRVFAWGNMAQFIEKYGKKGQHLVVHGRLITRTYLNKQGTSRKVTEVEVNHIIGLD
jgi:single-strand DNA-binding protein